MIQTTPDSSTEEQGRQWELPDEWNLPKFTRYFLTPSVRCLAAGCFAAAGENGVDERDEFENETGKVGLKIRVAEGGELSLWTGNSRW